MITMISRKIRGGYRLMKNTVKAICYTQYFSYLIIYGGQKKRPSPFKRHWITNCTTHFFGPPDGSLRDRDTMVLDSGQSNFVAILVATTIHTNIYLEFKVFEVSGLLSCPSDPANKSKNVNTKFHEFFDQ